VFMSFQGSGMLRQAAWALFALLLLFAPSLAFAHTSAAAVGRFLAPDPARFFDSRNLYAFCANDPVNGCDPDGMLEAHPAHAGYDARGV